MERERVIFLEEGDEQLFNLEAGAFEKLYEMKKKSPFLKIDFLYTSLREIVKEIWSNEIIVRVTPGNMRKMYGCTEDGETSYYYELDIIIN